jgi:hypothetical protein
MQQIETDLSINLHSAIAAAKEAVEGFKRLPSTASRAFLYTGNKLMVMSNPQVMHFGIAKTAAAKMIWDCSVAYKGEGFK